MPLPAPPAPTRRALLGLALAATAARPLAAQTPVSPAGPVTLTDVAGRRVTLPAPARRLLLGEGRLVHAVAVLEREDPVGLVAGWMGEFRRLDPAGYAQFAARFPAAAGIPVVGASSEESFSVERALEVRPDLAVLGLEGHGPGRGSERVAQLERAGIPVVFVDFRQHPLANTGPSLAALGAAIGRAPQAAEFNDFREARLARIRDRLAAASPARPKVLMEMRAGGGRECCGSPGNGNLGEFIELAGGHNIGRDLIPGALGPLNAEYVLAQDPAVYVATGGAGAPGSDAPRIGAGIGAEEARAALSRTVARVPVSALAAVREGRAHALWHNFYNSPFNLLAAEALATWIHPALFRDVDPAATLAEINRRFMPAGLDGTFWVSLA